MGIGSFRSRRIERKRTAALERAEEIYSQGRKADAAALSRDLAEADLAPAQLRLAQVYERGEGVLRPPIPRSTKPRRTLQSRLRSTQKDLCGARPELSAHHAAPDAGTAGRAGRSRSARYADLGVLTRQSHLGDRRATAASWRSSLDRWWYGNISAASYPTAARRPANSVLDTREAIAQLGFSPSPWRAELQATLQTRKSSDGRLATNDLSTF